MTNKAEDTKKPEQPEEPKPEQPKRKWWARVLDTIGNAIGEAKFDD